MTQPMIQVEGLSKVYHLSAGLNGGYRTLRESIMNGLSTRWHKIRPSTQNSSGSTQRLGDPVSRETQSAEFRALDDVTFEVQPGEVLGIVGRNGAGKSTLLKILSQITEPSEGQITLHGRVGSLLEVGTGFHPELTGRENVFLNGAILGMSRLEITPEIR